MTLAYGTSRILAGTGHRPGALGGFSDDVFARLVSLASWAIATHKPTAIISCMALGWDQALARAAVNAGIPFDAAVPFAGQENVWPRESVARYKDLLSQSRKVIVVSEGGYAAWKLQRRNEWAVDHCDAVLALWSGADGGTANCVRYAESRRPVINVWDEWAKREVERLRDGRDRSE